MTPARLRRNATEPLRSIEGSIERSDVPDCFLALERDQERIIRAQLSTRFFDDVEDDTKQPLEMPALVLNFVGITPFTNARERALEIGRICFPLVGASADYRDRLGNQEIHEYCPVPFVDQSINECRGAN